MEEGSFEMIAKTLYGLEDVLAEELKGIGAENVVLGNRMVSFNGNKRLLYKANFQCRTALRILKIVSEFKAYNPDDVYDEVKKIKWDSFFSCDRTFAIDAVVYSENFNHSKFVAYKTKDAIVDYFKEKYENRPSVSVKNPDFYINIHISQNDCTISLDSSGESLHKRGYRVTQGEAPLNEILAAGMILKTGWCGKSDFVDPFCGSGTLLIEAAMIALNIAPGIYRKEYAFERWLDFDSGLFEEICNDDSSEQTFDFKCFGSDISPKAIENANVNVKNAGLSKYIDLSVKSFQQYADAPKDGILITNPPYGERISPDDILALYGMIGERLKHVFMGYNAWILSYKDECFENIGLKPKEKIKLMNGELECEYRCYELFEGKNKDYKKELGARRNDERPKGRAEYGARNTQRSGGGERRREQGKREFGRREFGGGRSKEPERIPRERKFDDSKFKPQNDSSSNERSDRHNRLSARHKGIIENKEKRAREWEQKQGDREQRPRDRSQRPREREQKTGDKERRVIRLKR
jgi:putative N6-adenine-specific DNA methylase